MRLDLLILRSVFLRQDELSQLVRMEGNGENQTEGYCRMEGTEAEEQLSLVEMKCPEVERMRFREEDCLDCEYGVKCKGRRKSSVNGLAPVTGCSNGLENRSRTSKWEKWRWSNALVYMAALVVFLLSLEEVSAKGDMLPEDDFDSSNKKVKFEDFDTVSAFDFIWLSFKQIFLDFCEGRNNNSWVFCRM